MRGQRWGLQPVVLLEGVSATLAALRAVMWEPKGPLQPRCDRDPARHPLDTHRPLDGGV